MNCTHEVGRPAGERSPIARAAADKRCRVATDPAQLPTPPKAPPSHPRSERVRTKSRRFVTRRAAVCCDCGRARRKISNTLSLAREAAVLSPAPRACGRRRRRRIGGPLPEYPPSTAARNTRTDAHVTRANLPFPAPTQFRDHRRGTITDPTAYAYTVQPPGPTPSPLFLHLETSAELIGSAASGPRLLREQGERRGSLSAPSPSSV